MSVAVKLDKKYTYADYLTWSDDEQWEIIEGVPYAMGPAPAPGHQRVLLYFARIIGNFLEGKPCEVFVAPFDVRLGEGTDEEKNTVVQPDISVICDKTKIDSRGCSGAPDLVIEILSPATAKKDMSEKFNLYEKYRVKEYWIVDPGSKVLHLYQLKDEDKYQLKKIYEEGDAFDADLFEGLSIDLKNVF